MSTEHAVEGGPTAAPEWKAIKTGVGSGAIIGDPRLEAVYRYWLQHRQDDALPRAEDINVDSISAALAAHTMVLDVVGADAAMRFRYRRVGKVFWRVDGVEPTGHFLDEVLPSQGGYRDYVLGIYREVVESRRPIYTENLFSRRGQSMPINARRISLPVSSDGTAVDMILAAHVFEYRIFLEYPRFRNPLGMIDGVRESLRVQLSEERREPRRGRRRT
jgi:hypothetical protein